MLLAVLGAGAGAATIVLLRHSTTSTPLGGSSSPATSSSAGTGGTLAPPETAPQIVNAINEPTTGPLPAGWTTVTRPATGTETAGFTIGAPASWTGSTTGYQTYLYDPSANANILIDLTPHTYPNDMLKEAQYIKHQSLAQNRFPGYLGVGLQAETDPRYARGVVEVHLGRQGGQPGGHRPALRAAHPGGHAILRAVHDRAAEHVEPDAADLRRRGGDVRPADVRFT